MTGIAMDATAAAIAPGPTTRLHIGCGRRLLPGWVNADLVAHQPGVVTDVALTDLPYETGSVDEILAEHVLEHLSFAEEALAWPEMARVLRPGGRLVLEVPDFEWICATFLAAGDEWREFYVVGHADHYAVEQPRRAPRKVLVPPRERVEGAGIDNAQHADGYRRFTGWRATDDNARAPRGHGDAAPATPAATADGRLRHR